MVAASAGKREVEKLAGIRGSAGLRFRGGLECPCRKARPCGRPPEAGESGGDGIQPAAATAALAPRTPETEVGEAAASPKSGLGLTVPSLKQEAGESRVYI